MHILHPFDPGYSTEPFLSLCSGYPGADAYPPDQFRVEWGPIFHRGQLDGSARVLVIGQDPAQHETIVRRVLVGEAGRRVQGLLAKLGVTRSYVLVNTFLYGVYGTVKSITRKSAPLVDYRNRWLTALLVQSRVEAVLALGRAADEAWRLWQATPAARADNVVYCAITHPTQPESAGGDRSQLAAATRRLLKNWNEALQRVAPHIHPDVRTPLRLYGSSWADGDRVALPSRTSRRGCPPGCTNRTAGPGAPVSTRWLNGATSRSR